MQRTIEHMLRHFILLSIRQKGLAMTAIDPRYSDVFYEENKKLGCHALTHEELRREEEFYHRRNPQEVFYLADKKLILQH
ncbi:hypothetical protein JXB27_02935 [Candidatus Woesearchaeota archaeon]|nr:hypothetical protein [Candidatus Woesearchaeota archaeon]